MKIFHNYILYGTVLLCHAGVHAEHTQKTIYLGLEEYRGQYTQIMFPPANIDLFAQAAERLGYKVVEFLIPNVDSDETHAVIFFGFPQAADNFKQRYPREKLIACIAEPPTASPYEFDENYRAGFGKILTWDDALIDYKKYHKYTYTCDLSLRLPPVPFAQKKFCCIVAGYLCSPHPCELYSERFKTIDFFERHAPEDLDTYGRKWWQQVGENYKTYRGRVEDKLGALQQYKFCICYENTKNMQGYITEKIHHCLLASCIPVYWGAPNIEKYIPANCFIARERFATNQEMYDFLKNMPEAEYQTYIDNIARYLESTQALLCSPLYFAECLCRAVIPEYDRRKAFDPEQIKKLETIDMVKRIFRLP